MFLQRHWEILHIDYLKLYLYGLMNLFLNLNIWFIYPLLSDRILLSNSAKIAVHFESILQAKKYF